MKQLFGHYVSFVEQYLTQIAKKQGVEVPGLFTPQGVQPDRGSDSYMYGQQSGQFSQNPNSPYVGQQGGIFGSQSQGAFGQSTPGGSNQTQNYEF